MRGGRPAPLGITLVADRFAAVLLAVGIGIVPDEVTEGRWLIITGIHREVGLPAAQGVGTGQAAHGITVGAVTAVVGRGRGLGRHARRNGVDDLGVGECVTVPAEM